MRINTSESDVTMVESGRSSVPSRWELAAETISVKVRWFGVVVGALVANFGSPPAERPLLNAILVLGAGYALVDTIWSLRGRIFLGRYPLAISGMESLFIGLLCYCHDGLDSFFRYYYFLSLVCCAMRHASRTTYATCALHLASYGVLYLALPVERQAPVVLVLTYVFLGWVTWASDAMSLLLKRVSDHLGELNDALRENQALLEERIAERTRELQEAQAHLLHQEKMAAFGLLAAGIAHEVGNPLTSISSLVQMLQRRDLDPTTREKLVLVGGQLQRIQAIVRELIDFSRPANDVRGKVAFSDVVDEALGIAKYYKGTKSRTIVVEIATDLPLLVGVRDQLVQAFLNLILNAIDATTKGGRIEVAAAWDGEAVVASVRDDGHGIALEHQARLFHPYFTTKRRGTGLGLFVTRKLLADHGGEVTCQSRAGEGTTFRVRLPRVAARPWPADETLDNGAASSDAHQVVVAAGADSGRR